MNTLRRLLLTSVLALTGAAASAQGGPGPGPGMGMHGVGPAASAAGMGMGPHGMAGAGYTYGWSMMSSQERNEHQERMRSMKTYEECKAYMERHHAEIAARAQAQGGTLPAQPRRDACAGLRR